MNGWLLKSIWYMGKIALIYTLVGSKEEATNLAKGLIQNHQAACVNIFPCQSIYEWEGKIQESNEWFLLIKTSSEQCQTLCDYLSKNHPYQIPVILCHDQIQSSSPFANWVNQQL